jgi:hypothetical protein
MPLEHEVKTHQALGNALGVIDTISSHEAAGDGCAFSKIAEQLIRHHADFRGSGVASDLMKIDTDGKGPHIGRSPSAEYPEIRP